MPGIDTDLEGLGLDDLPARLAKLLLNATARVEADAAEPAKVSADATARSIGVIARTGTALVVLVERLARLRARPAAGELDPTEEADMDDAQDAGAWGAGRDLDAGQAADIERRLRKLAGNLRLTPLDLATMMSLDPATRTTLWTSWATRAHSHQFAPPDADWTTWLLLGGRGAGKTRAGAEWLTERAQDGPGRFALVGPTLHDVREVMIEGPSGLRAIRRGAERPVWQASRRRLVWEATGAMAHAFSAEDPDSLRGPQFHAAWADEFCAWRTPDAVLSNLRLGLRLGARPRLALTTTPKPIPALRRLLAAPGCVRTDAATAINAEHLAPGFLASLQALYGGTRLAAQELDGLLVEDDGAALWRVEQFARLRGAAPARLERVVLAVDPPASARGDACGLVVAARAEGRGYVLADRTAGGLSPLAWGGRAAAAAREFGAHAIVAEANQGGDMVRAVLAVAEPPCPVKLVHATRAKRARAEPVAALYEQGRVTHCGAFPRLEEELLALGSAELKASPDRADALVWALTDLLLDRPAAPRVVVL